MSGEYETHASIIAIREAQEAAEQLIMEHAALFDVLTKVLADVHEIEGYWTEGLDNTVREADEILAAIERKRLPRAAEIDPPLHGGLGCPLDAIKSCPDCGGFNQHGEVCPRCQQERDDFAREAGR